MAQSVFPVYHGYFSSSTLLSSFLMYVVDTRGEKTLTSFVSLVPKYLSASKHRVEADYVLGFVSSCVCVSVCM